MRRAGPVDPRGTRNRLGPPTPNKDRTTEYQDWEGEEFEGKASMTMEEAIEAITDTYHKDKWPDQDFAQKVRNFYYKRFQAAHKKEADKSANFANAVMLVELSPLILIEFGPILASAAEGVWAALVALGQSGGGLTMAAYLAASYPGLVSLVEAIATYIFAPEGYIPSPEGMLATGEELAARRAAQQVEEESEQVAARVANSIPPGDLPPGGAARARVPVDGAAENRMTVTGVGLRARPRQKAPYSERVEDPHYSTGSGPRKESQAAKATGTYGGEKSPTMQQQRLIGQKGTSNPDIPVASKTRQAAFVKYELIGDTDKLANAGNKAQVYLIRDSSGTIKYVGSVNVEPTVTRPRDAVDRLMEHLYDSSGTFEKMGSAFELEVVGIVDTDRLALGLEQDIIGSIESDSPGQLLNEEKFPFSRRFEGEQPDAIDLKIAHNTSVKIKIRIKTRKGP
jgi:hypothetical protein